MDNIEQSNDKIGFTSSLSLAARALIMIMGLFPLLAPYELLIKPSWNGKINWLILLVLLISTGAIVLSILIILTALFGINQFIQINSTNRIITHGYKPGVLRLRQNQYLFSEIEIVQLKVHEWTAGPPTYNIRLKAIGHREIEFGGFATQEQAEQYLSILKETIKKRSNSSR
jgi:hypothetical protein